MSTAILVFILVSVGLILGKLLLIVLPILRKSFVPSSILGGLIALLGGPEVWGRIVPNQPGGIPGQAVYDACAQLPGFLISVVFAALFLGKKIPPLRAVWHRAGPQVAFGQAIAWGMYMVGLGVTMVLLTPLFGVPPAFGTLLEIGFEGGHGTAAGLEGTFKSVGWAEGKDLALGVATVGIVTGILIGMLLINWAARSGQTVLLTSAGTFRQDEELDPVSLAALSGSSVAVGGGSGTRSDHANQPVQQSSLGGAPLESDGASSNRFAVSSIEPISLHVAIVGCSVGVGAGLLLALQFLERQTLGRLGWQALLDHMPLFPLAMIGGIIVQRWISRYFSRLPLRRATYVQLQNVALDYLIVAAMASLSLKTLAANWQPLAILVFCGVAWILIMFLFFAPRMLPDFWFERGIGDLGQSLGMTATGLLLMKIVDPDYRSPAYEAFGYKQLLFEPFVGGGLVTAMAVPLVVKQGPLPLLALATVLTIGWIGFGLTVFGRRTTPPG